MDVAKERESHVHFELYRLLKNSISQRPTYNNTKCTFVDVIPEYPMGKDRADLVVFVSRYTGTKEPFLVVEVKKRVYTRVGQSAATALSRVLYYAEQISSSFLFAAVYDGWSLLVFRKVHPYLIIGSGSIVNETQVTNLLLGLEEHSYTNRTELLSRLPKYPDPAFFSKQVFKATARVFIQDPSQIEAIAKSWQQQLIQ